MMDFLFTALLVPLMPSLASPSESHEQAVKALQARLNQAQTDAVQSPVGQQTVSVTRLDSKLSLPEISGRLFGNSHTIESAAPIESLRLTGLIETAGQYVGILNDGEKDHVVAVGSYVMNTHRVVSLGKRRLVMMPIQSSAGGAPVELGLLPGDVSGGYQ